MDLAVWRDISLLWLITLTFFAVAPFGVLLFLAVRGMIRLRRLAKEALTTAQAKARQVASVTDRVSQKVAAPLIAQQARLAQADGIRNAVLRRKLP